MLTEAVDEVRKAKRSGEPINVLDVGANVG